MPFSEMVSALKTKNWTASYIKRALFKITLRIAKAITSTLEYEHCSEYYFLIGYSDEGKKLIKHLTKPVSINFTFTNMNNTEANMFSTIVYTSDCYSHSVYASVFFGKNNKTVI
jgi:predicted nucleotidyltransferase